LTNSAPLDVNALVIVPQRKIGTKIMAAICIILLLLLARAFWKGDIAWEYVGQNLFTRAVMAGVGNTIVMTFCAMIVGIVLGVLAAIMRMSDNPVLRSISVGYVWLFRGTPALLQLLLWFNLALIFPTIGIPGLWSIRTVDVMTPFVAALLGLGIQQGAYTAEVVRAGLLSIDKGQMEAARSLGMSSGKAMRTIILPQAIVRMIPPLGNEFIALIKNSALVSLLTIADLMHEGQKIISVSYRSLEVYIAVALVYLVLTSLTSLALQRIEKHLRAGGAV